MFFREKGVDRHQVRFGFNEYIQLISSIFYIDKLFYNILLTILPICSILT